VISDIWRCDGREILPLMLDDSASRGCHESRGTRYSERHFAHYDASMGACVCTCDGGRPMTGEDRLVVFAIPRRGSPVKGYRYRRPTHAQL